ncbi:MAG TPA: right-handed parallel beta-helix repeat-containing protein, partial [Bryobacteraceae bacterium]|nr:right-handed parallel beta-helix repeat-containing protein [Bryobacteraceae bacterium]
IAQARVGDTVVIPPGKYREQVRLREGIAVRAQQPGAVTITPPGLGPAVIADKIASGSIEGVWVLGGGIRISDSTIAVSNVYVTGAAIGIEIRGHSEPIVTASQILNNQGPGISIVSGASPKLERNLIAANGKSGVEVDGASHPVLRDNAIVNNAAEPIRIGGPNYDPADYIENFFGGVPAKQAIHVDQVSDLPVLPARGTH